MPNSSIRPRSSIFKCWHVGSGPHPHGSTFDVVCTPTRKRFEPAHCFHSSKVPLETSRNIESQPRASMADAFRTALYSPSRVRKVRSCLLEFAWCRFFSCSTRHFDRIVHATFCSSQSSSVSLCQVNIIEYLICFMCNFQAGLLFRV